jgi:hypothetical protein
MRPRVCLLASAVLILLIDAPPLPAATAAAVNIAPVDVCSLLTQTELSAAVGIPTDLFTHSTAAMNTCMWTTHPPKGGSHPPMTLIYLQLSVFSFAQRIFDEEKQSAGQANVTNVSGLGDQAYYAQITPDITVLNVKKGDKQVHVTWAGAADHQTVMDDERTIAAQVLSEL